MAARVIIYAAQCEAEAKAGAVAGLVEVANLAANDARATAPVQTGEYKGGIGVEAAGDHAVLFDSDPEAFYKEYGTSDTPAHMTLTNAARKYGKYTGMGPRGGRG